MPKDDRRSSQTDTDSELKITDRRHFTADGQLRSDVDESETVGPPEAEAPADWQPTEQAGFDRRPVEEPAGVDFAMLVNSMAELALLFLGEIAHPSTGQPAVDLPRARIQIDMLDLLRVKCRGNLESGEEQLLERVLYELKMRYLARSNPPAP